jgi:hypothetical protein
VDTVESFSLLGSASASAVLTSDISCRWHAGNDSATQGGLAADKSSANSESYNLLGLLRIPYRCWFSAGLSRKYADENIAIAIAVVGWKWKLTLALNIETHCSLLGPRLLSIILGDAHWPAPKGRDHVTG